MTNKELEFDVLLIASDYVSLDFHSFSGKGSIVRKILLLVSYMLVFVGMALLTLKFWYLLPFTLIIIFYPIVLRYAAIYRFKSHITRQLREHMRYTIRPDSLLIIGESFSKTYKWSDFCEATEDRNAFYFWETDSFAQLLPKRYLSKDAIDYIKTVTIIK